MPIIDGALEMRQVFYQSVGRLAAQDERVVVLDADLSSSSGANAFAANYPDRFFNCGIQEANMVGVAAGLSAGGFIPFVHSFAAFISRRALDQVFVSCAYAGLDVRLVGSDPGLAGHANGGTHMALEDVALMRSIPGVVIVDFSDPGMIDPVLDASMRQPGVYYFRLFRKTRENLYPQGTEFELGTAYIAKDYGNDATIISAGFIGMREALKAADLLRRDGVAVRVLDMFTIAPLDAGAVLAAAAQTRAIVTLDNHSITGGLGSAVAEILAGRTATPFRRLGATGFGEVGTLDYVLEKFGLNAAAVAATVRGLLGV
ncbi:MAG: transketolase family protein [Planctomycetota bacterium]|jgi:transketolase|nr:transketolase family protein [Planctomycetota bacterium]